MALILVADDDVKLQKMLMRTLTYEGFEVLGASDGEETLKRVRQNSPDLLVLDWMMPKLDGMQVIETLRQEENDLPILMLTARDSVEYRVQGLESGADDYLVKPFATPELIARINVLLRRVNPRLIENELNYGSLTLNTMTREINVNGRMVSLTPTEFELMHLFMQNPNVVMEREMILQRVWNYAEGIEDNVLEVYIGYLRKKLEQFGTPRVIRTVRGIGYVLRED